MTTRLDLKDLKSHLTCGLCTGFFRDAHTILECMHTFCKSCILSHFHNNNVRGSIECPTCDAKLGLYGHLSTKMIYDRDVQSVVDKLFPQFIAFEKQEEIKFYADKGIPLKSLSIKHERDKSEDVQGSSKKAKLSGAAEASANPDQEEEFNVRIDACEECDESLRMPALAKRMCKAQYSIKIIKLKKFVHKRLPETMQEHLLPEDIEMIYKGHAVEDDKKLSHMRADIVAALKEKTTIAFTYRKKRASNI